MTGSLAISPDGHRIAAGVDWTMPVPNLSPAQLALSANGRTLAIGFDDDDLPLSFWSTKTRKRLDALKSHESEVAERGEASPPITGTHLQFARHQDRLLWAASAAEGDFAGHGGRMFLVQ